MKLTNFKKFFFQNSSDELYRGESSRKSHKKLKRGNRRRLGKNNDELNDDDFESESTGDQIENDHFFFKLKPLKKTIKKINLSPSLKKKNKKNKYL